MNCFPPEVWDQICSFACTDDGRTGRSLSLVSRSINEISKPYKLQSIKVLGHPQLLAFATLLESLSLPLRRVTWIFISAYSSLTPREYRTDPQTESLLNILTRILRAIAPSVKSVHVYYPALRDMLLPVSLPVLEELVRYGHIFSDSASNVFFPALRRLQMGYTFNPLKIWEVLKRTPHLTHFRILAWGHGYSIMNQWDHLSKYMRTNQLSLPSHLEKVYVYASKDPQFFPILLSLKKFTETDLRIVLLSQLWDFKMDIKELIENKVTAWNVGEDASQP